MLDHRFEPLLVLSIIGITSSPHPYLECTTLTHKSIIGLVHNSHATFIIKESFTCHVILNPRYPLSLGLQRPCQALQCTLLSVLMCPQIKFRQVWSNLPKMVLSKKSNCIAYKAKTLNTDLVRVNLHAKDRVLAFYALRCWCAF